MMNRFREISRQDHCSIISVDVDDLWTHYQEYGKVKWQDNSIIEPSVLNAIDLFNNFNIKATFFIIGKDIVERPEMMEKVCSIIKANGHEIANHGFWHKPYRSMSDEEVKEDISLSTNLVNKVSGVDVVGFRSPYWDLSEHVVVALEDLGYKYDASIYPSLFAPFFRRFILKSNPYMFGSLSYNCGYIPKSCLEFFPLSIAWGLPFYSSIHIYGSYGIKIFDFQVLRALKSAYCSYIFHAIDFIDANNYQIPLAFYNISYGDKTSRIKTILNRLTENRHCITMSEYAQNKSSDNC